MAIIAQTSAYIPGDRSKLGWSALVVLTFTLVVLTILSITQGASDLSASRLVGTLIDWLSGKEDFISRKDAVILFDIRLPRLTMGVLVGAALATSGACLQGLFRNPLADPGIIGVSAGATLAAIIAIVLGNSIFAPLEAILGSYLLPAFAFIGSLFTTVLLYVIATSQGQTSVATMLLAGIALAAILGAGAGLLTYISDDQQLRDLTFWSMGGLGGATWGKVLTCLPFIAISLIAIPFFAKGLNALLLGDHQARHMGIPVQRLKRFLVVCIALAVGAAVSVSGTIGFVGIIVPHVLRLVIGPDHRFLLPASALLGAILLIVADMMARTIAAPAELPIGIIMSAIGGPFFLWLLLKNKRVLAL
ncbi:FecCD family ABC transporter permease [Cohaesibacter gelatinilyticus]|uniref:Iron complex transport system permease protein n=1 Tax=Cohaesibacter gelatinilyticus TaxID=372072 RepID=A0A285PH72_9HYPH|nr:iron ABC transporter permease [Cohaesibacter gelatinilyticus]SNZ20597.1 iron complex transport system permease protein [Cohaesibacter gelatinilyticus]HAT87445.1 iron ABC transporter permease [Hyphomicrobiales bacterium]